MFSMMRFPRRVTAVLRHTKNFISSYKTAFAHIWPKIEMADVKIVLQSVKDKELNELRRMTEMMSSDSSKPALIKENRPVPALENILVQSAFY